MANALRFKILLLVAAAVAILGAIATDAHRVAQAVAPPPTPIEKVKPAHLSGMEKTVFDKDLK